MDVVIIVGMSASSLLRPYLVVVVEFDWMPSIVLLERFEFELLVDPSK